MSCYEPFNQDDLDQATDGCGIVVLTLVTVGICIGLSWFLSVMIGG